MNKNKVNHSLLSPISSFVDRVLKITFPKADQVDKLYSTSTDSLTRKDKKVIRSSIIHAVRGHADYAQIGADKLQVNPNVANKAFLFLKKLGYIVMPNIEKHYYIIYWGPNSDRGLEAESLQRLIYFAKVLYSSGEVNNATIKHIGESYSLRNIDESFHIDLVLTIARNFNIIEKRV